MLESACLVVGPGTVLGERYRLEEEIGLGPGVFRAADLRAARTVAVKVLGASRARLDEFRREAAIAMRARHPNLVGMLDAGVARDACWLVFEYVPGMEVRERISHYGPMGVRRALDVASQLFTALDALHRSGLAHGDIKPDNVLLEERRVRVFDYGMGRHHVGGEGVGVFPGTLEYMHPSLFRGGLPDAATDCFAAWATTYELLAGRRPYTIRQLRAGALEPPASVGDGGLDQLLAAGLAGALLDARGSWVALNRFLRGRAYLPSAPPAVEIPEALHEHVLARARAGASLTILGDPESGRVALARLHRDWVGDGGLTAWIRAGWASAEEPLSGALSLAGQAVDGLDGLTLASIVERLGPLRETLASALPAARAWLGTRGPEAYPSVDRLAFALAALVRLYPARLIVLVEGLDRIDDASRMFLAARVAARELRVVGTSGSMLASLPETVALPVPAARPGREDALDDGAAYVLARARALGLPYGPALAHATGLSADAIEDAALEAEAHGLAVWDGVNVMPRG